MQHQGRCTWHAKGMIKEGRSFRARNSGHRGGRRGSLFINLVSVAGGSATRAASSLYTETLESLTALAQKNRSRSHATSDDAVSFAGAICAGDGVYLLASVVRWCAVYWEARFPPELRYGSPRRQASEREYTPCCPRWLVWYRPRLRTYVSIGVHQEKEKD
jgi:hypothetical protein